MSALRKIDCKRQSDGAGAHHHDGMVCGIRRRAILIGMAAIAELQFERLRHGRQARPLPI